MCPNRTYDQLDGYFFGGIIYYSFFDANMNISSNDACHLHHYSGNITTNTIANYTITTSIYLCKRKLNFNIILCADVYCDRSGKLFEYHIFDKKYKSV